MLPRDESLAARMLQRIVDLSAVHCVSACDAIGITLSCTGLWRRRGRPCAIRPSVAPACARVRAQRLTELDQSMAHKIDQLIGLERSLAGRVEQLSQR